MLPTSSSTREIPLPDFSHDDQGVSKKESSTVSSELVHLPKCTLAELGSLAKLPLEIRRQIYLNIMEMPRIVAVRGEKIPLKINGKVHPLLERDVYKVLFSPPYDDPLKGVCITNKEFAAEQKFQLSQLGIEDSFEIQLALIAVNEMSRGEVIAKAPGFIQFHASKDTLMLENLEAAYDFADRVNDLSICAGTEERVYKKITPYSKATRQITGIRYMAIRSLPTMPTLVEAFHSHQL